ncbi:hypothetical protein SAMN04488570_3782 [Nocardioides scoriae]|uniref:Uncharacterized protein n=1 Tax=Nocardioides scoriae TaxID=642780 RepID=A0A1H1YBC9_9ACTN|nr:hypothetical protein [Nocardioides scoriae]SDT18702.1 hypothetical protein SAMN04488570_3782 [Nocardioides scoriae]
MVLVSVPVAGSGSARASCAAPELAVAGAGTGPAGVARVPAGGSLAVAGRGFVEGCDDTGGATTGPGCGAREPREVERPRRDVALVLVQGSRRWTLGTADAGTASDDRLGRVSWRVEVPAAVRPGPARLVTRDAELRVRVVAPG